MPNAIYLHPNFGHTEYRRAHRLPCSGHCYREKPLTVLCEILWMVTKASLVADNLHERTEHGLIRITDTQRNYQMMIRHNLRSPTLAKFWRKELDIFEIYKWNQEMLRLALARNLRDMWAVADWHRERID